MLRVCLFSFERNYGHLGVLNNRVETWKDLRTCKADHRHPFSLLPGCLTQTWSIGMELMSGTAPSLRRYFLLLLNIYFQICLSNMSFGANTDLAGAEFKILSTNTASVYVSEEEA